VRRWSGPRPLCGHGSLGVWVWRAGRGRRGPEVQPALHMAMSGPVVKKGPGGRAENFGSAIAAARADLNCNGRSCCKICGNLVWVPRQ
jgi:hypothetical protein